jgi:hypothetical protein
MAQFVLMIFDKSYRNWETSWTLTKYVWIYFIIIFLFPILNCVLSITDWGIGCWSWLQSGWQHSIRRFRKPVVRVRFIRSIVLFLLWFTHPLFLFLFSFFTVGMPDNRWRKNRICFFIFRPFDGRSNTDALIGVWNENATNEAKE